MCWLTRPERGKTMNTIGYWIGFFNWIIRKWEVSDQWKGMQLYVLVGRHGSNNYHQFWF